MDVPAGYTQIAYDPQYVLTPDKKSYTEVTGQVETRMPYPMPVSMMFWAGPGSDASVIKAASAYESATHHRIARAHSDRCRRRRHVPGNGVSLSCNFLRYFL